MFKDAPTSYKDPFWSNLAAQAANEFGVPADVLKNILLKGEKSNADQVSSAGARTPFQIIPQTRQGIIKNYGFDPYASPQDAARGAAVLIKESLSRNQGNIRKAVQEYHGGLDPKGYGPVNAAYVERVMGAQGNKMQSSDEVEQILKLYDERTKSGVVGQAKDNPKEDETAEILRLYDQKVGKKAPQAMTEQSREELIAQIPTGTTQQAASIQTPPKQPTKPGVLEKIGGGLDALATMVTAGTTGLAGGAASGVAEGLIGLLSGKGGDIPAAFERGMQQFTRQPRTETGQDILQGVGSFLTEDLKLPPVLPIVGPTGAIAPAIAAQRPIQQAAKVAQAATKSAPDVAPPKVFQPMQGVQKAAQSPQSIAPELASAAETSTAMQSKAVGDAAKGATTGIVRSPSQQALAQQVMPNPEVIKSAEALGIREYLQPDHITTNQAYRELSQAVKSIPGSETRAQEIAGLDQIAKRAEQIISDLGGTTDYSQLGADIRARMLSAVSDLEEKSDNLYKKVRVIVPEGAEINAKNTLAFIEERAKVRRGVENLSADEKMIFKRLSPKDGELPTYAMIDDVRKDIGEGLRGRGVFKDSNQGLLSQLYGKLTADQKEVVKQYGADKIYEAASRSVSVRKGIEDDMTALFGKELDKSIVNSLNRNVAGLAKGDAESFTKFILSVPQQMRKQVAASGLSTAFGMTSKRGDMSYANFANWYDGLQKNKQAYSALMSNLEPSARQTLQHFYNVSDGIRKAQREFISTGRVVAYQNNLKGAEGIVSNVYEVAKRAAPLEGAAMAVGLPPGVASAIATALMQNKTQPIKAADQLLASPKFQQLINAAATDQTKAKSMIKSIVKTPEFKVFAKQINLPSNAYESFMLSTMAQQNEEK